MVLQKNHLTRPSNLSVTLERSFQVQVLPLAVCIAIFRFGAILWVMEVQLLNVFYYLAEAEMETRAVSAHLCPLSSWLRVKTIPVLLPIYSSGEEKKPAAICQLTP